VRIRRDDDVDAIARRIGVDAAIEGTTIEI
jgi:hypothetical protein